MSAEASRVARAQGGIEGAATHSVSAGRGLNTHRRVRNAA